MKGNGEPAKPQNNESGEIRRLFWNNFHPNSSEIELHGSRKWNAGLLRLINAELSKGQTVTILTRTNKFGQPKSGSDIFDNLKKYEDEIQSFFPKKDRHRISVSTVHRFKGREDSAVIIPDANANKYPIIHPTWIFLRVFGDTIEKIYEQEQKLLYVAITRAKTSLTLISDNRQSISPFLEEIKMEEQEWKNLKPFAPGMDDRLEIRINNRAILAETKDLLNNSGYKWNNETKRWSTLVKEADFSINDLKNANWCVPGIIIETCDSSGNIKDRWDI